MNAPVRGTRIGKWTPLRQWGVAMLLWMAGLLALLADAAPVWPYYAAHASLLLFAVMNPVLNALRPGMRRSLAISAILFAGHAALCFLLLSRVSPPEMAGGRQLFGAIIVFYFMGTAMSVLFRGIYTLLSRM